MGDVWYKIMILNVDRVCVVVCILLEYVICFRDIYYVIDKIKRKINILINNFNMVLMWSV